MDVPSWQLGDMGETLLESSLETLDEGDVGGDIWLPLTKLLDVVELLLELTELLPDNGAKGASLLLNALTD